MASHSCHGGDTGGVVPPPIQVEKSAITLDALSTIRQGGPSDLEHLRAELSDRAWLRQLNTDMDYLAVGPTNLQLFFILDALASQPAQPARQALDQLAADPLYRTPGPFLAVLLEVSRHSVQPPENLVSLWKEQLQPEASELNRTVDVVISNGGPTAIGLLERALVEQKYREDYVVVWLRNPVLRHRQDPELLRASDRLLQNPNWPKLYRTTLVEALFDYRPQSWYHPETPPPQPPARGTLSDEARALLLSIAGKAREMRYLDARRYAQILKELEK